MLSILEQIEAANRQPEGADAKSARPPRQPVMSRNGLPKKVYDLLEDGVRRTISQTATDLGIPIFRAREALGALSRREQIEWEGPAKDRTYWRNA